MMRMWSLSAWAVHHSATDVTLLAWPTPSPSSKRQFTVDAFGAMPLGARNASVGGGTLS